MVLILSFYFCFLKRYHIRAALLNNVTLALTPKGVGRPELKKNSDVFLPQHVTYITALTRISKTIFFLPL